VSELFRTLASAPLTIHGRIVNASNHTMLVEAQDPQNDGAELLAVYKPQAGERPLWDFPYGSLHLREVAAFEVSRHLGWDVVPPTVLRDGPLGIGSVQLFIDHDPRQHYFVLVDDEAHHEVLARMAMFDLLINNADRKGGHVLLASDGSIWGCDHGLSFHVETKLRTVIWEFGGTPLSEQWCNDLRRLAADLRGQTGLRDRLQELIDDPEIAMLAARADALVAAGSLPDLDQDERPYPWPPI
jgi:uncharacterized repeat protein (TIGR03843 family)